nr:penicillin acylase family protein [Bryobacter sp.]
NKGTAWETLMSTAVIEKLLRERPSDWFDNYDELLLRALADAVEEGKKRYGPSIGNWRYGAYNALRLQHPVLSRVPQVGQFFTLGPVGMDGSSTTVKQTTPRIGPSMRMVADLSNWDNSLLNTTVGQSGMALSKHFDDQWKTYLAGRSFPMQFRNVTAAETLNVTPGN